jgi:hypothetical protein
MSDEFQFFTEQDKRSMAYWSCVGGTTLIGAGMGSLAGGQTLPGAAGGLVWGLFTCKYLQEPVKKKLFGQARMSEAEFKQALAAVHRQYPRMSKGDALGLLATARQTAARNPGQYRC